MTQEITILTDLGSFHNFLNEKLASKLKLPISLQGDLKVMGANGEHMKCAGKCRYIKLKIGEIEIETDFYLLNLDELDAILGIHWL